MDKRSLWSKILVAVALMLTVGGWLLILGVGLKSRYVGIVLLGNILALAGAILSKSSRRKLLLWGAGGAAAGTALGVARVTFTALTDKEPPVHPIIIGILALFAKLCQLAIIAGAIYILLEPKQPASPPNPGS